MARVRSRVLGGLSVCRLFAQALIAVVAAITLTASPAAAEIDGGCEATINGTNITNLSSDEPSHAIKVRAGSGFDMRVTAPGPVAHYVVQIEFAGVRWTAGSGTADGLSWRRRIQLRGIASYGVGLYKVHAVSTGSGGCTGSALVRVLGNPLGTVAGLGGLIAGMAGLVGLSVIGLRTLDLGAGAAARRNLDPSAPLEDCFHHVTRPAEYVHIVERLVASGRTFSELLAFTRDKTALPVGWLR